MKKLQVCEGQNPCLFIGAKYLIFCTSIQLNSLKVIQWDFLMTMWFCNDNYELLVACGNCCWPHLGFTNVAQDIVQHITHARKKKDQKKKEIGHLICHQWFIRSRVSARRLFPEVTHCPFMSEDTHALTDLPLVWIHGRINTSASKCFHFFSLFFPPSPSWVLLILLWLHKSPPAVEGVRQLELRQGNGSGVSAPRVTGQILNDDTRQCARRKKKG